MSFLIEVAWKGLFDNETNNYLGNYIVQRASAAAGPFITIAEVSNYNAYLDASLSPTTTYYYRVIAKNADGYSVPSAVIAATTTASPCSATGTITREYWAGLPTTAHGVASIPVTTAPSTVTQLTSLESSSNQGNNYGERVRGYICAPASGSYTFWLASDNEGELWLSPDDQPAHKARIAFVSSYTASREWNKFPSQRSVTITLEEGKKYYVEVLHKEGSASDNLAVGWRIPFMADNAEPVVIPGSYLSPYTTSSARQALSEIHAELPLAPASLYPNPSSDQATIEVTARESDLLNIQLYNLQGQPVQPIFNGLVEAGSVHQKAVNTHSLTPGLYLVRIANGKYHESLKLQVTK